MQPQSDFNFHETLSSVTQAVFAVVSHILFDAALHGLVIAAIIAIAGFVLSRRKHRFSRPLFYASRRLALACLVLTIPGWLTLLTTGHLPPAGFYSISSLGYIAFFSYACIHLCAEEMNFQWFVKPAVEGNKTEGGDVEDQQVDQMVASVRQPDTARRGT